MKRNHILACVTACSMAATSFGADSLVSMSWGFDTADNPATATPGEANPIPATGTAEITVGFATGYSPGPFVSPPLNFGTATGIWDIGPGGVKMDVDLYAATPEAKLDYSVVVRQFASTAPSVGFPYSPVVTFSVPGWTLASQVEKEVTSNGTWIESTYTWQQLSVSGPVTLTMTSDGQRGLLLDSLAFYVLGDLVPIPEPSVTQLGALGAFLLGIGAFRRRKRTA